MIPPQEPGSAIACVNTTGSAAVPFTINFPPFSTTKASVPLETSDVIFEPASIVTVTPDLIFTIPLKV